MKVLISNIKEDLEAINNIISITAGLDTSLYSAGAVNKKVTSDVYWYNIESVLNCSKKQELITIVEANMDPSNLPSSVSIVDVGDLELEGYVEGYSIN